MHISIIDVHCDDIMFVYTVKGGVREFSVYLGDGCMFRGNVDIHGYVSLSPSSLSPSRVKELVFSRRMNLLVTLSMAGRPLSVTATCLR